jgi:hypothetical protein
MLPLRAQNEDTFRSHLLMTFAASVIVKKLQDSLKDTLYNPISVFLNLRNQKCKVYESRVIPQEAFKKTNDVYKHFEIPCPTDISRSVCLTDRIVSFSHFFTKNTVLELESILGQGKF